MGDGLDVRTAGAPADRETAGAVDVVEAAARGVRVGEEAAGTGTPQAPSTSTVAAAAATRQRRPRRRARGSVQIT